MKTPDPGIDPEKLLKEMEAQMMLSRQSREVKQLNRNVFRIVSLVVLLGGTMLAFGLLEYMLSNLPQPEHLPTTPAAKEAAK
ncbi:MAG: hypothetical protein QM796_14305 [Chthoniobacteraceae bacterium]